MTRFKSTPSKRGRKNQSSLGVLSNGDLVVAWRSYTDDGESLAVFGQRLTATGEKIGEQFQVGDSSTDADLFYPRPEVVSLDDGGFQIAWLGGWARSPMIQTFDENGVGNTPVNLSRKFDQRLGEVAFNSDGTVFNVSTSGPNITSQLMDRDGTIIGETVELAPPTTGDHYQLSVSTVGLNQYLASWVLSTEGPFGASSRRLQVELIDTENAPQGTLLFDIAVNDYDRRYVGLTQTSDEGLVVWGLNDNLKYYDKEGQLISTGTGSFRSPKYSFNTDMGLLLLSTSSSFVAGSASFGLFSEDGDEIATGDYFITRGLVPVSQQPYIGGIDRVEDVEYIGGNQLIGTLMGPEVTLQSYEITMIFSGGAGDDLVTGTPEGDILNGLAGNDRLLAGAGDDTLNGGNGADTLNGGDGDDLIYGGGGAVDLRDVIYAGAGNDTVFAGYGNDLVFGMDGGDQIAGGFGADELHGQNGNDTINGGALADQIFGGDGDDFLNGGFGYDLVNGGAGADKFYHNGTQGHGSDWLQDFDTAEGDVLLFDNPDATVDQFVVRTAHTEAANGERSGDDSVEEAFVVYQPTGQIIWALVDGGGQDQLNIQFAGAIDLFDLLG